MPDDVSSKVPWHAIRKDDVARLAPTVFRALEPLGPPDIVCCATLGVLAYQVKSAGGGREEFLLACAEVADHLDWGV